jgi:broad specificity phosphatase PhoE
MRVKFEQMTAILRGNKKKNIVVVTHGVFMMYLSGVDDIDLPKAGWNSFPLKDDEENTANTMTRVE